VVREAELNEDAEAEMQALMDAIRAIRNIGRKWKFLPSRKGKADSW
jgi:hypothetical protein